MKHFNFRKLMMLFALLIIVQNGVIIVQNTDGDTGAYSEEGQASPLSDHPYPDDTRS